MSSYWILFAIRTKTHMRTTTHTHPLEPIRYSHARITEIGHDSENFTKLLLNIPTYVCKREHQDFNPGGCSRCHHNSTTTPRGGSHLPIEYIKRWCGRVFQYISSMCESHAKYPILPQAYQSSHVGTLLFSCLTGQGLKFGAKYLDVKQLTI